MGRNAGWLTGAAALAKGEDCDGPDMIYLPEIPFDLKKFGDKVRKLLEKKTSIVVAVSEGIRTDDGTYVCELGNSIDFVDAFGHKQLSGTASYLASLSQERSAARPVRSNSARCSVPHPMPLPEWTSWKIPGRRRGCKGSG